MSRQAIARAIGAFAVATGFFSVKTTAATETYRVAAVDPDAQLARALEVALSPWGTAIVALHLETPGATMPIAVDRARDIALEARADVVVWVSSVDSGYALWIYDVASDHTSARGLESSPPFDAATAAAVALAVKTLLRGTVVAPPPERFGAVVREPRWMLGASLGVGARLGTPTLIEPRVGLDASVWPVAWGHRWGISLGAESGPGAHVATRSFAGTVADSALRIALGGRIPISEAFAFEASLGGALHLVGLDGVVLAESSSASEHRVDVAIEPRVGMSLKTLGGRLFLTPWFGASVLTRWQRFLVRGVPVLDLGPLGVEGALCAALAFP